MNPELIFIDTETTGLSPADRLIQVAYKTSNGDEVNEYFDPQRKISIASMAVHHITEDMIDGKPVFKSSPTYQDLVQRFTRGDIFVAHNAPFDVDMIEREGINVGPVIDTHKVARYLDPEGKIESYALQYLRYLLGIDVVANAHDAWGDILVLEKLFYRMLNKLMQQENLDQSKALEKMIDISKKPILYHAIPFGKYKDQALVDIAKRDPDYLKWLLGQKESDEDYDENWVYTLRHYLHLPTD